MSDSQLFTEDLPPRLPTLDTAEVLIVSFDNWEGPLDLLLALARNQKIDLVAIPILPLVEQYLAFIAEARKLRLEIAADYLVMAAWLAYLKSALLLPREEQPDPDPEVLAERLRWRLQRLEAMRHAADQLFRRDLLGRDVFVRGMPEGLTTIRRTNVVASLYDLLSAYGDIEARGKLATWTPHDRGAICSLDEALEWLSGLIGSVPDWKALQSFLPPGDDPGLQRSRLASGFVAALELARLGKAELQQTKPFTPLLIRNRQ